MELVRQICLGLCALVFVQWSLTTSAAAQENPPLSAKIIHGTPLDPTGTPFARLDIADVFGETDYCSGTLISASYVLTAGHCFSFGALSTTVVLGFASIPADFFVVHPRYHMVSDTRVDYDAALVHLSRPAEVAPLPIARSAHLRKGSLVAVTGYGMDEHGMYGTLRIGTMTLSGVSQLHLKAIYTRLSNTCYGDSGGPAITAFFDSHRVLRAGIVGIVSTGTVFDCGYGDYNRFTNVQSGSVVNFIKRYAPDARIY